MAREKEELSARDALIAARECIRRASSLMAIMDDDEATPGEVSSARKRWHEARKVFDDRATAIVTKPVFTPCGGSFAEITRLRSCLRDVLRARKIDMTGSNPLNCQVADDEFVPYGCRWKGNTFMVGGSKAGVVEPLPDGRFSGLIYGRDEGLVSYNARTASEAIISMESSCSIVRNNAYMLLEAEGANDDS